ncbi:MAG: arginine--tRNA ligase [Saprospiraceae bacterium]
MKIIRALQLQTTEAVKSLYNAEILGDSIKIDVTNKEFEGDYTVAVFPFVRFSKKSPEQTCSEIGEYLKNTVPEIAEFNVIKGFLNLTLSNAYWCNYLLQIAEDLNFGKGDKKDERIVVEFSSPNTNKPLHLGHVRNILLGWSCIKILETAGYNVIKTKVVNDRGIAICKSMLAWKLFGNAETPQSSNKKGDHLVGEYYVMFENQFKKEYKDWQVTEFAQVDVFQKLKKPEQTAEEFFINYKNTYFNEYSQLGKQAREMLLAWEKQEPETIALWKQMNGWVYTGFNETYKNLGVDFDKIYYESDTYALGRATIEKGLKDGVFYQKDDGSIWIDLTDAKLDHKVVLRGDGTSIYITQDIGMAPLRYEEFKMSKMVFVVADEQDYHFKVLFEILKRLGEPYAAGMYHLSYGMVELPTGRMKSREGTVVDADDLIAEVIETSRKKSEEVGVAKELAPAEKQEAVRKIAMSALKYHLLKVQPKKKMIFDPEESVQFEGQTGPYIQYNYVRAQGAVKKGTTEGVKISESNKYSTLADCEKELIIQLIELPEVILRAANEYDPAAIASFAYQLAKAYSKFWSEVSIFRADEIEKAFRLQLSAAVAHALKLSMSCLGIEMPERM